MMAMAGETLQVHQPFHNGAVDRFHGSVRNAVNEQESKQCYLNNNSVDYVFRVNSLRSNNLTFDRANQQQTIRIRVSSIDEPDDLDQQTGTLASKTAGEERLSKEEQLSRAVQGINLDPSQPPRVVLCAAASTASEQAHAVPRSRSPSPLLEVPLESVDISREIRRPPL
ncbi:uncharacterized protein LOC132203463 [Neocloeon triangulifer]|uniref:uncharacterized protein LOC132203463 n=1 Tax=Neocloeon triangulifer TaxID=2078957 RepID=UPI00286F69FE|nr:uncharacterized protein LOC132203463 [Neocloeon triangulifer]